MSTSGVIRMEGTDRQGAVRGVLRALLESGVVDAVLAPRRLPSKDGFAQTLFRDPGKLAECLPLAPTIPVHAARILSDLSGEDSPKVAAVVRPCEVKGAVELSKFNQVALEQVFLVTAECPGTLEVPDYARASKEGISQEIEELLAGAPAAGRLDLPEGFQVRPACRICEHAAVGADVVIRLSGAGDGLPVEVSERLAEAAPRLGLELLPGGGGAASPEPLAAARKEERARVFEEFRKASSGLDAFLDAFSACIRCHNCMTACPICFCKECVFKTAVFDHEPGRYVRWADRKGSIRMPTDTLLFHLIRMSHMVTSCIGCGLCDSACPSGLPVSTLFASIGENARALFDYVPGRDAGEAPPVADFREDELEGTI